MELENESLSKPIKTSSRKFNPTCTTEQSSLRVSAKQRNRKQQPASSSTMMCGGLFGTVDTVHGCSGAKEGED